MYMIIEHIKVCFSFFPVKSETDHNITSYVICPEFGWKPKRNEADLGLLDYLDDRTRIMH